MLYELQPLRFQKNIVIPAIRELQELFVKNGKSEEWLINLMYEDVCVRKYVNGEKRCAVTIREFYYHDMIMRACNIGGLYKNMKEEKNQRSKERENKLINLLESKYGIEKEVKFSELKKIGFMDETIQALYWIVERYEFAINFVELIDKDPIGRKKKFSSMLDEL